MPPSGELILGLVTHEGSRFRSGGLESLQRAQVSAKAAGVGIRTLVSDRNDASREQHSLTRGAIADSARYQADLEARWRAHVAARGAPTLLSPLTLAMRARRSFNSADSAMRLLNIDYSHLRIWRHALATGAPAALVIEDDAQLVDDRLGELLATVLPAMAGKPLLVNLSQSIDVADLRIADVLANATTQLEVRGTRVTETGLAVTNTVCANLYSREFLKRLVSFIDRRGLMPVVPIDWRVNDFLLSDSAARTWWVEPAPFLQGSMHPQG